MKLILCSVLFFISIALSAQDFYINLQTGYGFATEAGQINYYNFDYSNTGITGEVVTDGLGEGIYVRSGLGYNYNKFIAFEFGFNFLRGKTLTYSHKSDWFVFNGHDEYQSFQNINAFIFSPQLRLQVPTKYKIQPYTKIGIAISPFIKSNIEQNTYGVLNGEIYRSTESEMKGGTSLGFTAALGLSYKLTNKISLLADCNLLNMSYRPYKQTITKLLVGNNDLVNDLSLSQRETLYVKTREYSSGVTDINLPREELPIILPMSNLSLNIGLQFNL